MKRKGLIALIAIIIIIVVAILGYFITKISKEKDKEYAIEQINEYKYFVVKEENKYGVINTNGDKIIETKYDNVKIPNPKEGVFFCYNEEKAIVLNEKSEEIFTEYEKVEPLRLKSISSDLMYEKTVLKYNDSNKFGIMDYKGKKLTKAKYDDIDTLQFKEGELLVKEEGKFGIININGATMVKSEFDKIEADKYYSENEGYKDSGYIVSNKTEDGYRYGYVNIEGKQILDTKYNELSRITQIKDKNVYLLVAENGKYGIFKNEKNIVSNEYQSLSYDETNNLLVALKGKRYGVISMEEKEILPYQYISIDITGKYIYAKKNDETISVFDIEGKETNIDPDTAIIKVPNTDYEIYIQTINNKTTYNIYKNQNLMTKNDYSYIEYVSNNNFIACDLNGKLGVIDENDNIKLNFKYSSIQKIEKTKVIQVSNIETKVVEMYSENFEKICEMINSTVEDKNEYIRLKNSESIIYISKEGKLLKNIDILKNNEIFADKKNGKWGFNDVEGNVVVDFKYDLVTEINQYGFAGVKSGDKWGVVNNNGDIIVEPVYTLNSDDPVFIGKYYQVIYGNGEIYYTK